MIKTRTHRLSRSSRLTNTGLRRGRRPAGSSLTRCHARAACGKTRAAGLEPRR